MSFSEYEKMDEVKKSGNPKLDVSLTVHRRYYVEIECQLDATEWFLLQNLLSAQHVSGTIMPIIRSSRFIQMVAACGT